MRALIILLLILWQGSCIAQEQQALLTFSVRDMKGTKFLTHTLRKQTHCRITERDIPNLSTRLVTVNAKNNTLQEVLRMAFPDLVLKDSSYSDEGECKIVIYIPEPDPAADVQPMDTVFIRHDPPMHPFLIPDRTFTNGFQRLPVLSAASSFSISDRPSLNRIVSPDITAHLTGISSGILTGADNPMNLSIHGRSTIVSASSPLLVWDNFGYFGNVSDINPYDIDSVTVLKDAASAAIWGSFSSNTVIVLTSGNGRYNQRPLITASFNTTVTEKPNLFYRPVLGSDSFISAETQFFLNGYYASTIKNPRWPFTPAVEILRQWENKTLSDADAHAQLNQLSRHSLFSDLSKYFYRSSISQQYHVSVTGGSAASKYYFSGGVDHDPTTLVRNRDDRYTLHGSYTFHPFSPRLEVGISFNATSIFRSLNDTGGIAVNTPYLRLTDAAGNPMPLSYNFSNSFVDTAGGGQLQDWHYRPLQELRLADNRYRHTSAYVQTDLTWYFQPKWSAAVLYRQGRGWSSQRNTYNPASYYVRNYVNQRTQFIGDSAVYGATPGWMRQTYDTSYVGNNLRAQLSYTDPVESRRRLIGMTGMELTDWAATGRSIMEPGIDQAVPSQSSPLPSPAFSNAPLPSTTMPIPGLTHRYLSLFSNLSYTWRQRFSVYGSYRLDASNDAGVDIGHKWSPFWALGISQQLLNSWNRFTPLWKLRVSYGCNGNVSARTAALGTSVLAQNIYGQPQTSISAAPDPARSWEKNYVLNIGTDFELLRDERHPRGRFNGSLDVYSKRVRNLVAQDSLSLSAGATSFWGNTAGINGNGLDLVLNSVNISREFKWTTNLLFSIARDWVSRTKYVPRSPQTYVQDGYPMAGKPVTGIYSYKWGGLDGRNGDPQGWMNGQLSKDYLPLQTDAGAGWVYSGAGQPQVFGHLLNNFSYRGFGLSVGLSYKGAFVIRRPSVNYSGMAMGMSAGDVDFDHRWMRPGDEKFTNVPSLPLINVAARDHFFLNSEATITRGDFLRWQDCRINYALPTLQCQRWGVSQANFYIYANNLGILWRANKYGIDPDAVFYGGLPAPRSWSIGMQIVF